MTELSDKYLTCDRSGVVKSGDEGPTGPSPDCCIRNGSSCALCYLPCSVGGQEGPELPSSLEKHTYFSSIQTQAAARAVSNGKPG